MIDPESGRLLDGQKPVSLAHKPFETLLYLAARSGRVVTKTELMERLWPDTFVTDDVLVQCVVDIRRALGDTAKSPHYIQTIPRRGYQFLVPVTSLPAPPPPQPGAAVSTDVPAAPVPEPRDLIDTEPSRPQDVALVARAAPERRTRPWLRLTAALLALAVLATAALLFVRSRPRDGEPEAPAALAVEPGSLVVMPVSIDEAANQSGWLREGLAEMIRSQLGQTPGIHVIARHRLAAALHEAGYDEEKGAPADSALRIARKIRVERMVTGSFVRVEDRFVITAQVVEVASGRTEGTASVRGRMPGDLLDSVDELCLKLLHQLRPVEASDREPWRPTRLATRSLEASKDYVEALGLFARGGREGGEQAEARLDEALRLDPTFAQAYVKKAEIQHWQRMWGYGSPDPAPAVRAAARLVKDLPDRERVLVESFEALIVRNQPAAALREWSSLLQFYPTYAQEVGIPTLVAETFQRLGRWDDLIMVGEAHVDSPSLEDADRARLCSLLATAFRRKGEFDRALQYARRAVTLWPVHGGPAFLNQRAALGRISLEAGRRAEALTEFRAVIASPDADVVNLTDSAWGLYMATEPAEAEATVDRALKLDPAYGNAFHLKGWLLLARGSAAQAAPILETAFGRTPPAFGNPHQGNVNGDLAALYYAGVAWLQAGERAKGEADLTRLVDLCQQLHKASEGDDSAAAQRWQAENFMARAQARLGQPAAETSRLQGDDTTYYVQSARQDAVLHRREQAMKELAQGLALGFGELRHVQDDPDFESLRADPEFKRLVTDRLPR